MAPAENAHFVIVAKSSNLISVVTSQTVDGVTRNLCLTGSANWCMAVGNTALDVDDRFAQSEFSLEASNGLQVTAIL